MIAGRTSAKERKMRAFELRKSGLTYYEIGLQLGISKQAAHQHVKKHLNEIASKVTELAKEVMTIELNRLDDMVFALYEKARSGDVSAIDRILKIMDRRAKYLGLDVVSQSDDSDTESHVMEVPVADTSDWEKSAEAHQAKLKREVRH